MPPHRGRWRRTRGQVGQIERFGADFEQGVYDAGDAQGGGLVQDGEAAGVSDARVAVRPT